MKQKDIVLIAAIVIVSGIVSLLVSNMLFGSPTDKKQEAEQVPAISASFPLPSDQYFNSSSIDPTQTITIGTTGTTDPFATTN